MAQIVTDFKILASIIIKNNLTIYIIGKYILKSAFIKLWQKVTTKS